MADEFDIVHIGQEDAQSIIDWAVYAASMVILMDNAPQHENTEEAMDRLNGYIQAIGIMWDEMPRVLAGPAAVLAQETLDQTIEEEVVVEEFVKQIEEEL